MARRSRAVGRGRTARRARRASSCSSNVAERGHTITPAMSPPESEKAASPAKRTPRKAAGRGKWSEEQLLTSDESALISHDLVKLLAKPEAWNVLEESEKREILALLPSDTHPEADLTADNQNAQIPPLPESFVRYSNNWRAGIRQFQFDLENGRYEPQWLLEAETARRQRENGDFDSFKEREFEQFWGQKQKMDMRLSAGECGRIPLGTLVEAGVFLPGDVWRHTFVFGKGADRIVIDKEARIHDINGSKLTFVIPSGARTFLTSAHDGVHETKKPDQAIEKDEAEECTLDAVVTSRSDNVIPQETASAPHETKAETPTPLEKDLNSEFREIHPQSPPATSNSESQDNRPPIEVVIVSAKDDSRTATSRHKRTVPHPVTEPPAKRKRGRPRKVVAVELEPEAVAAGDPETGIKEPETNGAEPDQAKPASHVRETTESQPRTQQSNTEDAIQTNTAEVERNGAARSPLSEPPEDLTQPPSQPTINELEEKLAESKESPTRPDEAPAASVPDEIILPNIRTPNMLVTKILQIDGRPKDGQRTANPWKEIRCYRKNQDMGSLWDVRQAWYFKQHPT